MKAVKQWHAATTGSKLGGLEESATLLSARLEESTALLGAKLEVPDRVQGPHW